MNKYDDRTDYYMKVSFEHPTTKEIINDEVRIPVDIFVEAIRQYCIDYNEVALDGTDNKIWNLFAMFDKAFDIFADIDSFQEICKDLYDDSHYKDEDEEDIISEYDFMHDLDDYSTKDDDEK